jgi:PBSX family phage terminase large subunit
MAVLGDISLMSNTYRTRAATLYTASGVAKSTCFFILPHSNKQFMADLLAPKQLEFISNSTARWNIAHGSVSSGKTIANTFRFMQAADQCPDSQIWIVGHTSSTVYDNIVRLIIEPRGNGIPDPLAVFRPFCTWRKGDRELLFRDKTISTVGAKDAGAIGAIQGKTMSIAYCDEMTLYPEAIIDMIDTRLRNPHSIGFSTMNPSYPTHKIKKWIDRAISGDDDYYQLHFTLDDNPYLDEDYKRRIKGSLSGVFYKRNYLGEWCLAEGAIFDFFDRNIYVVSRPPRSADYWIVGVDYGTNNAFAAVLLGVSVGKFAQEKAMMWVEKEYYWDYKVRGRQQTSTEFADDLKRFISPYSVKSIYIDPSAANFRLDLRRLGLHSVNADNDVSNGISKMTSLMKEGSLFICSECVNLIREIESYVWHPKCAEKGEDEPLKADDHALDALRYAINTHKPANFSNEDYWKKQNDKWRREDGGWRHPNDYGFR